MVKRQTQTNWIEKIQRISSMKHTNPIKFIFIHLNCLFILFGHIKHNNRLIDIHIIINTFISPFSGFFFIYLVRELVRGCPFEIDENFWFYQWRQSLIQLKSGGQLVKIVWQLLFYCNVWAWFKKILNKSLYEILIEPIINLQRRNWIWKTLWNCYE